MKRKQGILHPGYLQQQQQQQLQQLQKQHMIHPKIHKIDKTKAINTGSIDFPYVIRLFLVSPSKDIKFLSPDPPSPSPSSSLLLPSPPSMRLLTKEIKAFI